MTQPLIIGNQIDQTTLDPNAFLPSQTGNSGEYLTTNGTSVSWAAAGGASYSIGTIIQAPTAPTDGGTWLECDGSAVSQATYATLFSEIGHAWTTYTTTVSGSVAPVTVANATKIVWTGTKWLMIQVSNTQTYTSTDGLSWSAAGTLPGTLTTPTPIVGPSGTVLLRNNGVNTTTYYTTNDGTSWSTATSVPTSSSAYLSYNGTHYIFNAIASRDVYYATNPLTGAWTNTANALPAAPGGAMTLWWDGSNWIYYYGGNFPPTTSSPFFTTSVSTGASGWSNKVTNILKTGGARGDNGSASNGSGISIVAQNSSAAMFRTSDAYSTITATSPVIIAGGGGPYVIYNGFSFIALSTNWIQCATSIDGLKWNLWSAPVNYVNMSTVNGWQSANLTALTVSACPIDTTTGRFTTISQLSGAQYSTLYSPRATLTTQFCLPSFMSGEKAWIKAL
jgi:hypothetical protein